MADAANRSMGSVINKYKSMNGLGYYTYTRLFQIDEVCCYKRFHHIDAIQNKAIRIFLGIHKFVSIDAINGDMGWTTSCERCKINMVRFWNRLMSLNNTRLPKVILIWDSKCRGNTWSLNIQSIFNEIDQENVVASNLQVSINNCWALFHEIKCN